jgi:hypothetical protein
MIPLSAYVALSAILFMTGFGVIYHCGSRSGSRHWLGHYYRDLPWEDGH